VRSDAADTAGFSGIGTRSQKASKISDLMSADQRFKIAQYGENLTSQNVRDQSGLIANEANLTLAPTEYSSVGSQIKATPGELISGVALSDVGAAPCPLVKSY